MQPGPSGAQCAIHVGVVAPFVCARCGNFMCVTCAENGAATQCPTCRAKSAAPGFPFDSTSTINQLFDHILAAFKRDGLMLIAGTVIFFMIVGGGGLVSNIITTILSKIVGVEVDPVNPFGNLRAFFVNAGIGQVVGTLVGIPVQGVAMVGFYRVLMDSLLGRKVDLARMFSQLQLLPKYVIMQLIMFFAFTLPVMIVGAIAGFMAFRIAGVDFSAFSMAHPERIITPVVAVVILGSSVVFLLLMVVVLPVLLFSIPELMVGDCSPIEAITRAWKLGDGQRLRVLGYSFISGVIVMVGTLACCIGLLPAIPISYMVILALFLALRRNSGLPEAT
jgi:uncharacterized membrane protein